MKPPTTETIDKLYLELSQFTGARTGREIELEKENERLKKELDNALVLSQTAVKDASDIIMSLRKDLAAYEGGDK